MFFEVVTSLNPSSAKFLLERISITFCFSSLVNVLCDRGEYQRICELPYFAFAHDVQEVLHSKAISQDLVAAVQDETVTIYEVILTAIHSFDTMSPFCCCRTMLAIGLSLVDLNIPPGVVLVPSVP